MGVSKDCPIFSGTPYYLRNGESYGFQIWHAHLWAESEQKPIKNSGKVYSRRRCQGLLKIFRAPIYRALRAVSFAIAQLSCLLCDRCPRTMTVCCFCAFVQVYSLWFVNASDRGSGSRKHWSSTWFSRPGPCNIVFCIMTPRTFGISLRYLQNH